LAVFNDDPFSKKETPCMKLPSLIFFVLILSCVFTTTVSGQVIFGAKGGLSLANVSFEDLDTEFMLTFNAGFLTRIPLAERFYLQPELMYSQKGYKVPGRDFVEEGTVTFNYLCLPVLVGYQIDKISFFAGPEAGLQMGVRTSHGGKLDADPYENFDVGLVLGANYNISTKVGIDLRYVHGFSHLIEVHMRDQMNNPLGVYQDGYNRAIQAGVVYFFNKN
jgi:hypothetical protein